MLDSINPERLSLKYQYNAPKGYEVSKIQFTFDFIYLVYKRDSSIDAAIRGVANEYGLSEDYLWDYLIENKYLINRTNKTEFSKQLRKLNTKTLKKILKEHGLKTSGKREKIEERIFENDIIENDYYLSSKSRVFYKNKKRRNEIFNQDLFDYYYFNEFNDFYMDNFRKKRAKIPVAFINEHIGKSVQDKSHDTYIFNCRVMAKHYFKKENCRKMLEYVLKIYCMNLNPIWKIDELKSHTGLDMETYDMLMFLRSKLSKNYIINTYYLVWDSFNFERIIIPKYEGYRYLKDLLNLKSYDRINQDMDRRFYSNEDLKIKRITQKTLFDF